MKTQRERHQQCGERRHTHPYGLAMMDDDAIQGRPERYQRVYRPSQHRMLHLVVHGQNSESDRCVRERGDNAGAGPMH